LESPTEPSKSNESVVVEQQLTISDMLIPLSPLGPLVPAEPVIPDKVLE